MPASPRRHVEGVEDEGRRHRPRRLPADQAPRVDVDDEGDVDDARPRRAVGEVRHPQGIGARCGEVALDEVGSPNVGGVGLGGEVLLRPRGSAYAQGTHETGHLVPAGVVAGPMGRLGELAAPIDRVVLLPEPFELGSEGGVADGPGRRWPGLGVVVGGGGDLQLRTDRLDSPLTPTGLAVAVGVDEGNYFVRRRSSSAPKKLAAAWRMGRLNRWTQRAL